MDSAAVILNPTAGPPRRRLDAAGAEALLRREGLAVEVCLTSRRGEATELAARAAERHPIVAAAGGDGTCREVAIGLLQTDAALAVLPTGSGNDFARGLGIRDARAGAEAAGRRATRRLDVGYLAGRPFVNSAGLFLSGAVSRRAGRIPRQAGPLRYVLGAVAAMLAERPARARWELEGEEAARSGAWTLAELGNGPLCGGGFRLTPCADPADGLLDFCLVEAMPPVEMIRLFRSARRGTHLRHRRVSCPRAAGATLRLEEAAWIHLDGEPELLAAGDHAVRLLAGRLRVLAGATSAALTAAQARGGAA